MSCTAYLTVKKQTNKLCVRKHFIYRLPLWDIPKKDQNCFIFDFKQGFLMASPWVRWQDRVGQNTHNPSSHCVSSSHFCQYKRLNLLYFILCDQTVSYILWEFDEYFSHPPGGIFQIRDDWTHFLNFSVFWQRLLLACQYLVSSSSCHWCSSAVGFSDLEMSNWFLLSLSTGTTAILFRATLTLSSSGLKCWWFILVAILTRLQLLLCRGRMYLNQSSL